ncbi:MAG: hypothetical protein IRZ00_00180 [Gemmatimonadetes bacterium]|nr:hypothetical protein [Gemmatimonadota bacterium]
MNDRLMMGMFWGGLILMAPPVLLGLGIAAYALQRYRASRRLEPPHRAGE